MMKVVQVAFGLFAANQRGKMHRGNLPGTVFFGNGEGKVEGESHVLAVLLAGHVSGGHQPSHFRRDVPNPEEVVKILLTFVVGLEEVLVSDLHLFRPRPHFARARSHDRGVFGEASQDAGQIVIGHCLVVRLKNLADPFHFRMIRIRILGAGRLESGQ